VHFCLVVPVVHVCSQHFQDHIAVQLEVDGVAVHPMCCQHGHCCSPVMLLQQQQCVTCSIGRCKLRSSLSRLGTNNTAEHSTQKAVCKAVNTCKLHCRRGCCLVDKWNAQHVYVGLTVHETAKGNVMLWWQQR